MATIIKPSHSIQSKSQQLRDLSNRVYDNDEIKLFRMDEAINEHPLKIITYII